MINIMEYKLIKNKKGLGPLVIPILLGVFLLVGILGGGLTSWKFNQIFTSPIMIIVLFFLVLWLLSGGKKRK